MDRILVTNIFAAVFTKSLLDPLLKILNPNRVKFWGTEGTVKYLKSKDFRAESVVSGFDFDGRVKTLDRAIFARILADRLRKKHLKELQLLARDTSEVGSDSSEEEDWEPFDLVIVDLYAPDPKNFPETMDIGGQALIRAAIKNFENVVVAFDPKSIEDLVWELKINKGVTSVKFRKRQAAKAARFIAERAKLEVALFKSGT